jgi:ABC-type glycerol-3-phosphate transport system substrate-binding protein
METQIDAEKKILDEGANLFKGQSGATVKIQYVPWGDAFGKYVAAFEANNPPDAGQHSHITPPSFAARGVLEQTGDLVKEIGEADFIPTAHDVVKDKSGAYWGVPWFFEMRTLWYWKDMLDQAGVKPESVTTWESWLDALKKLTKGEVYGLAIRASKGWGQYWSSLAVANGGPMLDKDGKVMVDSPQHLEALTWWTDLFKVHKVSPPGTPQHDQPAAQQLFLKRQVAMLWDNATVMDLTIAQSPDNKEKLGVMHVPAPKQGGEGLHFLGGSSLMVFKASKNKDAAKEWTKFLHTPDFASRFFKAQVVNVPNRKSLAEDPYFKEPWKQTYITAGEKATFYGYTPEQSPYIVVLQTAEGSKVFAGADEQVFGGFMSAEQSLKDTQKKVDDIKKQVLG